MSVLAPIKPTTKKWTRKDFRALPDGPPFYELNKGVLLEMPRPRGRHQKIIGKLYAILSAFIEEHNLGDIWPEVEVDITDNQTFVPDLTFLTKDQLSQFIDDLYISGAPELVIEVASPSTASYDKSTKLLTYQEAGVLWYWTVEDDLLVTEYKNSPDGYIVNQVAVAGDDFTPSAFSTLTFNLAELMGETPKDES